MSLIVRDDEYSAAGKNMMTRANYTEEILRELLVLMEQVSEEGLMQGNTAQNFARATQLVKAITETMQGVAARYYLACADFINEIDAADADIYD